MRDRKDWVRDTTTDEHKVGNRTYKNLVRFSRSCATCAQPFSIFVTTKIADGNADSNSFGLRNCEKHRRTHGIDPEMAMANTIMKAELDGCYEQIKYLKARLALYELPAAMHALAGNGTQIKMPWE